MTKSTKSTHIATGDFGEEQAAQYLSQRGFRLLARNWRPKANLGKLELDIVGQWESYLVFVEVKTRRVRIPEEMAPPAGLHNFTSVKQRNLARAARAYLAERDIWDSPCRFDLICVTFVTSLPSEKPLVEHYRNVIELGKTLDSGNATWQP